MKKLLLSVLVVTVGISCSKDDDHSNNQDINYSKLPQEFPFSTLATINGVDVINGGFGSGAAAHPSRKGEFYVITDRGPNTDYLNGKKFLTPNFTPTIMHFKINAEGKVEVIQYIKLKNPSGQPITGLPNPVGMGSTGEVAYDASGNVLGTDKYGLDSESIVAAPDGTFWVSDEYGPHIVHYSAEGVEMERISPVGVNTGTRKLPAVLAKRRANRGMEGLCLTPDGRTLVGTIQSMMYVPSKAAAKNTTLTRIVTFDTVTGQTKQFLYKQEGGGSDSVCDITALSNTEFLVIERDGNFGSQGGIKKVYRINISAATDVTGTDINAVDGMKVNNKALEECTWDELNTAGIKTVTKTLAVDLVAKLGYEHDKFEGIVYLGNNKLAVFNDDDFGVVDDGNGNPKAKILPKTGKVDKGTMYIVDIQ
ncbi:esterase-like activity of phytase family protein [Chryseobacterium indologenes]|uniref:Esterase-like activity of phytase family protein n=1 Tax=Chryseobacterium indologenes TaxID=253 RepID=A0A4U8VRN1_CHRID|nr:esterase-like activity of phytase family protein [Chryseobacterium indologenes]AYZ36689.1 esterase-like activity of phytase family protein [Chryseobacterium indologenes]AZB20168.1 esterase-like activity of phytase family protein [Chryseobacterium indologenes]MBF6645463.1 esterase-like activity of phytase family protein [Chryseobacterium indologenes]MBU3048806.1 esterase-like activity of phytase family protein [Chryseobacterium indologenes]MEB4760332.1 esterase-like activity of phytase famil